MALKIEKTFHSMSYFTQLCRLISNILWKTVDLFCLLDFIVCLSTLLFIYFIVCLSTLPMLNDFLKEYDFVMKILGDFRTTKKLP